MLETRQGYSLTKNYHVEAQGTIWGIKYNQKALDGSNKFFGAHIVLIVRL